MREESPPAASRRWLNGTVLGIGTASFLSDVSHETATCLLPLLASEIGNPAAVLGAIEGISDAASGAARLWAGWITDRLSRRKPLAVAGYVLSAAASAGLGFCTAAWHAVGARAVAWAGRGLRTPPRNALMAAGVPREHYGKAFGLERAMDTLGAVVGPLAAAALLSTTPHRTLLLATAIPGAAAALAMGLLVREASPVASIRRPFLGALAALPSPFRRYLAAVGLFGMGDFAHSMIILRSIELLSPGLGSPAAASAAIGFYGLHNVVGAAMAYLFGAMGDRFGRRRVLAASYGLGPLLAAGLMLAQPAGAVTTLILLASLFALAGAMRAAESALETAAAAELLPEGQRGMGFGALAFVNSSGDLVSSLAVGALWQAFGPAAGFGAAIVPMLAGALLLLAQVRAEPARR